MTFKEILAERGTHRYELHYSDGIRGVFKGNNPKQLIDKIQQRKGVRDWALFRNSDGFHGTHQEEYLEAWWSEGGNSYWDNKGKSEPAIMKKKYKERVDGKIQDLSTYNEADMDEARQVTDAVVSAFMQGASKRVGNSHTDGRAMYLHNNKIAEMRNGQLWISNAGWFSATTKERLNGLPGVAVQQKAGKWYLNGKPWDGTWIQVDMNRGMGEAISSNFSNMLVENLRRLENVGHNKGHNLFERANEILMINEGGKPIFFKRIDNSHFFMADNLQAVQTGNVKSQHIRVIENKLFAQDIAGWLSGKKSAEELYGSKYKYKQG